MIFGIDNFASVEFATTLWHDIKNWIDVCDHTNIDWEILAPDTNEWENICSLASDPWQKVDTETTVWETLPTGESNPWVKPALPANDITRC